MSIASEPRDRATAPFRPRWIGLILGASIAFSAAPVSAQENAPPPAEAPPEPATPAPVPARDPAPAPKEAACPPCKGDEKPPSSLQWKEEWPRVTLWEHTATALFGAGALALLQLKPRDSGRWENSFDEGVRDALRFESHSLRKATTISSDIIFYGLMLYPIVVDTLLVAGSRDSETAWEMTVMNLQSLAVAGATSIALLRLTGRERPFVRECAANPEYDEDCSNPAQHNVSFTSGHTLMAFAGAGLVCAHHQNLPLYGGGWPDTLACVGAVGLAHAEAFARVATDVHYATDVIAGGFIGFGIGYLLPRLLHYRGSGGTTVSFAPYAGGDKAGIAAMGWF